MSFFMLLLVVLGNPYTQASVPRRQQSEEAAPCRQSATTGETSATPRDAVPI